MRHEFRKGNEEDQKVALAWTHERERKREVPREVWIQTAERRREQLGRESWKAVKEVARDRTRWRDLRLVLCRQGQDKVERSAPCLNMSPGIGQGGEICTSPYVTRDSTRWRDICVSPYVTRDRTRWRDLYLALCHQGQGKVERSVYRIMSPGTGQGGSRGVCLALYSIRNTEDR
jgi:hypothetical protein